MTTEKNAEVSSTATKLQNLKLWNELKPVTKEHTKNYKRAGGFSGTMIDAQWRLRRMTELFGPVGQGWGYDIDERWSEAGCAFVQVCVWYKLDGKVVRTGPQIGGTDMGRAADEAYKASITDAIGKCCAQLGLGSDIYMGQYDMPFVPSIPDSYVQEIRNLLDETNADEAAFLNMFGVASLTELSAADAVKALAAVKAKKKKQDAVIREAVGE